MATNNVTNTSLSGQTGTGNFVGSTSPALTTPNIGTPSAGTLTNCTGLPGATGITGAITAANLIALGNSGVSSIGTFTRDISLASGTQSITGVGFQPSLVIFFGGTNNTSKTSFGYDNGTSKISIFNKYLVTPGDWGVNTSNSMIFQDASGSAVGNISAFGADGFTISWTKNGTVTGTVTVSYLAFK